LSVSLCFNDYDFPYWAQNVKGPNVTRWSISLNFGFNLRGTIVDRYEISYVMMYS